MRSLAIDVGNTRAKVALFEDGVMKSCTVCEDGVLPDADCAIASLTGERPEWLPTNCIEVSHKLKLPVRLDYATPETLGSDRIAAACAAWSLYPDRPIMVVDAGTCVTVDYVSKDGVYHGGAILPGIEMKFRALNTFTARLPLLNISDAATACDSIGDSTCKSIVSGVVCALRYSLEGYVCELSRRAGEEVQVVVTGGDAKHLAAEWLIEPNLVMRGLNEILMMNL
ncbi:MAG: type III pantothenate kinase [Bacteroidales bacterium]|nr:type III pantothenate kinase [Bacteroidales bacterium]